MGDRLAWPSATTSFATCGNDLVVLDIKADDYSVLADAGALIRVQADSSLLIGRTEDFDALHDAGWIQSTAPAGTERRKLITPTSAYHPRPARPSLRSLVTVLAANETARRTIQTRSLAELIRETERRGCGSTASDGVDEPLARLLDQFEAARVWTPALGKCLQRSFMMNLWLARHGVCADWMFGVRTWPFSAHCWLQAEATVIGDDLERVRRYKPILCV